MFKTRYMAGNKRLSQRHKGYDEKNMSYGGSLLAKSK